jgi:hypothetical protein
MPASTSARWPAGRGTAAQETILTHYGAPAAVVISFEKYQRLKQARDDSGDCRLPAEITAQISDGRQHPERRRPRPRRASRTRR